MYSLTYLLYFFSKNTDNLVHFDVSGVGYIDGVDNGDPRSHEPFKAHYRKAFNGKCLVIIRSDGKTGTITVTAAGEGLSSDTVTISTR